MAEVMRRRGVAPRPGLSVEAVAHPMSFDAAEPGRGRLAHGPHKIPARGWKDIAWRTYQEIGADRLNAVAGGVTFYTLLALFPAIGVFVSLYGLFADIGAVQQQLTQMAVVFPREAVSIVGEQMIRLASRPSSSLSLAFVVSLLLSVWSANAGMKALFDGLNIAYDEEEKRSFIHRTLLTYGFTLGALVFLVIMAGLLVATPMILDEWASRPWRPYGGRRAGAADRGGGRVFDHLPLRPTSAEGALALGDGGRDPSRRRPGWAVRWLLLVRQQRRPLRRDLRLAGRGGGLHDVDLVLDHGRADRGGAERRDRTPDGAGFDHRT